MEYRRWTGVTICASFNGVAIASMGSLASHCPLLISANGSYRTYLNRSNAPHRAALEEMPGVNSPYWHLGAPMSGTTMHCEDAKWRSYNFVRGPGFKIWVVIKKADNQKFLDFISRHWDLAVCDQFVRHLNLVVGPETLKREVIGFQIYCLGEGEMFVTREQDKSLASGRADFFDDRNGLQGLWTVPFETSFP